MPTATVNFDPHAPSPTEAKVVAGTLGAGAGAILAEFINWILDDYLLSPAITGDLPTPVSGLVLLVSTAALAWVSAWSAKHTARPDLPARLR